jgi:AraC family transcriptional regulator, regulatory protein of adaptative response / DNA-3-methyladenine glycosylase II
MELDHEACYRALSTRDARFDGRMFTAVRTTGVYCRPICPARTPKRENVTFYPTASAAQEAGFRPCLRCRPESSPDLAAWRGTSNTVSRGLALIAEGALDREAVDALAERLGVGERQLRRLFRQHLGASPIAVAQTRRVLFAKQLIVETTMPMTEVALASGFSSIRRFNATFHTLYRRPPRELRRSSSAVGEQTGAEGITLMLAYAPPYDWDAKRPAGWAGRVFLRAIKRFSSVRGRHGAPCTDAARGHYRYLSPGNAPLSMWSCHRVRGRFSLTIPPGASWRSEPSQGWSAARPRPTAHVRSHSLPPATLRTKPSI